MSLKPFTYPFPETRFLHAGPNVYKFKIRYGDSIRGEEIEDKEVIIQELEDSIRAVLANMDNLQPFVTEHFIIFPYKSKWERVSHLKFKHGEIVLAPYPFVFTLYIEMKWFTGNLPSGKPTDDIPLDLISEAMSLEECLAEMEVLAEKKAKEATRRKRKLMEEPSSPSSPGSHRAKVETSSEAFSNEALTKPLKETKRIQDLETQSMRGLKDRREKINGPSVDQPAHSVLFTSPLLSISDPEQTVAFKDREGEAQQEYQDTPASDATDVQEQDSKLGHSLPGLSGPSLQQIGLPPQREPAARGFFGFLSTLFPFRYFVRKSWR